MGRDSLILVDKEKLTEQITALLMEERSDVPETFHRRDAERLVEKLEHPSF
jgi:hypothetical protein